MFVHSLHGTYQLECTVSSASSFNVTQFAVGVHLNSIITTPLVFFLIQLVHESEVVWVVTCSEVIQSQRRSPGYNLTQLWKLSNDNESMYCIAL